MTWDIGCKDFLNARDSYKAGRCGGADNQDCARSALVTFKANWDAIIREVLSLRNPRNTIIHTMNLYNPYVATDMASNSWPYDGTSTDLNDFQVFKPFIDQLNT